MDGTITIAILVVFFGVASASIITDNIWILPILCISVIFALILNSGDAKDDGDVDCAGSWGKCEKDCTPVKYTITTQKQGSGEACDFKQGDEKNCKPGNGNCAKDGHVDCVGSWAICEKDCKPVKYTITTQKQGSGQACGSKQGDTKQCLPKDGNCGRYAHGFETVRSDITGVTPAGLKLIESNLPKYAKKQKWKRCFNSVSDCSTCPSDSKYCTSKGRSIQGNLSCDGLSFKLNCDAHSPTVVIGHNSLKHTFGGFATSSWKCPGKDCPYPDAPWDKSAAGRDTFLFHLGPREPKVYSTKRGSTKYQWRDSRSFYPSWGSGAKGGFDLTFGNGELGKLRAGCGEQGSSYEGKPNEVCGGDNWGKTEMEVWYIEK